MATASGGPRRLIGTLRVPLRPEDAFGLFTPRGEQVWVPGWQPRFPAPTADDTEPGTVFETGGHGRTTTWVVVDRLPGRLIRYARVVPGIDAGTVTVSLDDGAGGAEVTVIYELTALTPAGQARLEEFARGYPEFLRSWQDAIAASLASQNPVAPPAWHAAE